MGFNVYESRKLSYSPPFLLAPKQNRKPQWGAKMTTRCLYKNSISWFARHSDVTSSQYENSTRHLNVTDTSGRRVSNSLRFVHLTGPSETVEASRRSSKVVIAETATDAVPRPMAETFKKSLLKSSSSGSVDKLTELDIRTTEIRSPSPIPEDPVEEEVSKQPKSTSAATIHQEKKIDASKEESAPEQRKDNEEASEVEKAKKEKKEEKPNDEDKNERSDGKGNNDDNDDKGETSRTKEKDGTGKDVESGAKENKPVVASTTGPRGKSKATGRIMGGWI